MDNLSRFRIMNRRQHEFRTVLFISSQHSDRADYWTLRQRMKIAAQNRITVRAMVREMVEALQS